MRSSQVFCFPAAGDHKDVGAVSAATEEEQAVRAQHQEAQHQLL